MSGARVTIPVDATCEYNNCNHDSEFAYIVTGDAGQDGIAAYCTDHSQNHADESAIHTAIGEVGR